MSAPKAATTARPAPLFRPASYDRDDREGSMDKTSPEMVRKREAIEAAIRICAEAHFVISGRAGVRKYVAALKLPLYRLVRLNEMASHDYFYGEHIWDAKDAGVEEHVWRWTAGDVHRAALSLLLDVEPQSYADVKDQLAMLFYTVPGSIISDKQRTAAHDRLVHHVSRMIKGEAFEAPRARRSKARA